MKAGLPGWRRLLISRFSQMLLAGRSRLRGTYAGQTAKCARSVGASAMARELQAADLVAVHLVGTVGEAKRAGVRVHARKRHVLAHARAAVGLDRPVDHLERH